MISILISAYACSPNWGSEQGMAWNWIVNISKYCNLYIITEGQWKDEIENAVSKLPQKENIHFFYNPVEDKIRRMCWDQGDWRFYFYYRKWQKKTFLIAKEILSDYHVDIIHQLNMVGFREPGYLWRLKDIPYVWGPIGGMENIPIIYIDKSDKKRFFFVALKNILNTFQYRFSPRIMKAIKRSDVLLSSVKGVQDKVLKYHHKESILMSETGCCSPNKTTKVDLRSKNTFDILWVGRFLFSKNLKLALETIAKLVEFEDIRFHIVGEGNEQEVRKYKEISKNIGIDNICIWHGKVSNAQVQLIMQQANLFFFTSIMEATSTVILEAISNGLPIICFNTCGFGSIVDNTIGRKVELSNPNQSIIDFEKQIKYLYMNRGVLEEMSKACFEKQVELSWDVKTKKMITIYNSLLKNR